MEKKMNSLTSISALSVARPMGRFSLVLLLAPLAVAFCTGCESMHCYTCPDARNQTAPAATSA